MKQNKKLFLVIAVMFSMFAFFACIRPGDDLGPPIDPNVYYIIQPVGGEDSITVVGNNREFLLGGFTNVTLNNQIRLIPAGASPLDRFAFDLTRALNNYNLTNNNLRVNVVDWGWDDPLIQATGLAFIAGHGPDIITGESQMPGFARGGDLRAFPEWLADLVRETMLPASYAAMEHNGNIYGIPISYSPVSLIWNRQVIRDVLGADSRWVYEAPATWSEFLEVSAAIRANSNTVFAGGPYSGPNMGGYLRSAPFVFANGGRLSDEQGRPVFNDPRSLEAYQFLWDVAQHNIAGALNGPAEAAINTAFQRGQIAYIVCASWRHSFMADIGMDVGLAPIPVPDNAEQAEMVSMVIGAPYLSVPFYVSDERAELAWKFLASVISRQVQEVVARAGFTPTAHIEIAEEEWYAEEMPYQFLAYTILRDSTPVTLPSFITQVWSHYGLALSRTVNNVNGAQSVRRDANSPGSGSTIQDVFNHAHNQAQLV